MNETLKILWIPGLGANEIMFVPLIRELNILYKNNIINNFIKFYDIEPYRVHSLEEYVNILINKNFHLLKQQYDVVIACSLGGMVLQILLERRIIHAKKYILLSTAFEGDSLTILSKIIAKIMYNIPVFLRKSLQRLTAFLYRFFRFYLKHVEHLSKMFYDFPTNVFFEAPNWIYCWKGIDKRILFNKNIFVIHGTSDPLISFKKLSKIRKPNLIFLKGNHILFSMYPRTLAQKIKNFLEN